LTALAGLWTASAVAGAYYFVAASGLDGAMTPGALAAAFGAFALVTSQASTAGYR
jgi:hypothetical protein